MPAFGYSADTPEDPHALPYYPADYFSAPASYYVPPQPFSPGSGSAASLDQQYRIVVGRSCPHGLHLLLTLVTFGLWAPIWLIHYLLTEDT
ncbi:MAG: DUF4234 domain-containing protein [Nocardia sp.]|nr:DUF4234 domain-containing protein [Nocardia sp.]